VAEEAFAAVEEATNKVAIEVATAHHIRRAEEGK
jgi:hypothetical protein